jgi:dephospho-CoA kinase
MRIIGLTGGIGTGKSTVANYLSNTYQLPLFDADIYAREAVKTGSQGWQEIVNHYGDGILLPSGEIDRPQLGKIIFGNPEEKLWLESLIHPYVRNKLVRKINESTINNLSSLSAIVLVVPLLFEAKMTDLVTEIWVVSCHLDQQIERIKERDRLEISDVHRRINSQMSLTSKTNLADVVIQNTKDLTSLYQQIDRAFN